MKGGSGLTGHSPWAAWMSVWQSPHASMRTSTCSSPGVGSGTSSTRSGWVKSWTTAAFIGRSPLRSGSHLDLTSARRRAIRATATLRRGQTPDGGRRRPLIAWPWQSRAGRVGRRQEKRCPRTPSAYATSSPSRARRPGRPERAPPRSRPRRSPTGPSMAAIYIGFGFLWYYAAKEKLIDQSGVDAGRPRQRLRGLLRRIGPRPERQLGPARHPRGGRLPRLHRQHRHRRVPARAAASRSCSAPWASRCSPSRY